MVVTKETCLMEGEWYVRGDLKEGVGSCYGKLWQGRENGHVTECHFNGGRKVVREVVSLMEGEWFTKEICLMEGEWSC